MAIVYRIGNGSALTYTEVDGNFRYLLSNMSGSIVAITGSTQISGSLSVLPEGTVNQLTSSWAISASVATSASYAANATISNVVRTNLGDATTQDIEGSLTYIREPDMPTNWASSPDIPEGYDDWLIQYVITEVMVAVSKSPELKS